MTDARAAQELQSEPQKMAVTTPPPASLAGLPLELFEFVAQHLSRYELKSLRLANRQIASKVFDSYKQALFSHQAYYMALPESIQFAIDISSHAVFGSALRKLTFLVDDVTHRTYKADPDNFMPPLKHGNYVDKVTAAWNRNGAVPKLLRRLFEILRGIGKLEEIELVGHVATTLQPAGNPSHDLNLQAPTRRRKPNLAPLMYLLFACEETSLTIPSLKINGSRWSVPPAILEICLSRSTSGFLSLLASLRCVSVCFSHHLQHGLQDHFLAALTAAPHLRVLEWAASWEPARSQHILCMEDLPPDMPEQVLYRAIPKLQELRLKFVNVGEDEIRCFVKQQVVHGPLKISLTDVTLRMGRYGRRLESPEKLLARLKMVVDEHSRVQWSFTWSRDWTAWLIPPSERSIWRP